MRLGLDMLKMLVAPHVGPRSGGLLFIITFPVDAVERQFCRLPGSGF